MPDFKTIADFRKDNGEALRKVYRDFVVLCRRLAFSKQWSCARLCELRQGGTNEAGISRSIVLAVKGNRWLSFKLQRKMSAPGLMLSPCWIPTL